MWVFVLSLPFTLCLILITFLPPYWSLQQLDKLVWPNRKTYFCLACQISDVILICPKYLIAITYFKSFFLIWAQSRFPLFSSGQLKCKLWRNLWFFKKVVYICKMWRNRWKSFTMWRKLMCHTSSSYCTPECRYTFAATAIFSSFLLPYIQSFFPLFCTASSKRISMLILVRLLLIRVTICFLLCVKFEYIATFAH